MVQVFFSNPKMGQAGSFNSKNFQAHVRGPSSIGY